jgi:hypothetical protein
VATETPTDQTAQKPAEQPKSKQKPAEADPLAKWKEADEKNGGLNIYNFR